MTKTTMINPLEDGNEHLREFEEIIDRQNTPAEEVVTSKRFIHAGTKKWTIERKDPYGFWTIIPPPKVKLHETLSGKYTSAKLCEHAIEHYTNVTAVKEAEAKKAAAAA